MKFFILTFLFFVNSDLVSAQISNPSFGKIIYYSDFTSRFVKQRNVDVWLPEDYTTEKKYAVLYMHDGQMLFDSSITWNKQEWGVDEVLTQLIKKKKIHDCIVVGIWNGGTSRHSEYFPQKPLNYLSKEKKDSLYLSLRPNGQEVFQGEAVQSDKYLKFITEELKPFIDKTYSTKTEKQYTFIAGSSMGGLISLYAICEYPDIFGGAACISTHWPGIFSLENNPIPDIFIKYLEEHLPSPKNHRIYFDHGTATLDSFYPPIQKNVDEVMKRKGYNKKNWLTREFPGANHSETAWRARLEIPIMFLLRRK